MLFFYLRKYLTAIPDFKEFILLPKLRKLEPIEISSDSDVFCIRFDNSGAFRVHFDGFANMNKICVFCFETFLELGWHLQSTRSRRLVNGF